MEPTESVKLWHGYAAFFSSIAFFSVLKVFLTSTNTPTFVSSKVEPWRWRNILVSFFHALLVGTWDILCFVLYPELLDDLVAFNNYFIYMIVPISAGYFIYDFFDYAGHNVLKNWDVLLHHIFVIWIFWYNFHNMTCIGYVVVALMTEINSIFLHLRKLLQMCQVSFDSTIYRSVTYVNFISFLICRFPPICYIIYGLYSEPHRMPQIYFPFLTITMVGMAVINTILLYRLLQTDILRSHKKVSKDKAIPLVNGTYKTNRQKQQ